MTEWRTSSWLDNSRYGNLNVPEKIEPTNNGCFKKGCTPWNKGMTWKQMGIDGRKQRKMRNNLKKGRKDYEQLQKAREINLKKQRIPILATRLSDGQEYYFECCGRFAEKVGVNVITVRRAMAKGYNCKGFKVERFYE